MSGASGKRPCPGVTVVAELNTVLTRVIEEMQMDEEALGSPEALLRYAESHFANLNDLHRKCWRRAQAILGTAGHSRTYGGAKAKLMGPSSLPCVSNLPATKYIEEACHVSPALSFTNEEVLVSMCWTQIPPHEHDSGTKSVLTVSGEMESCSVIQENIQRGVGKAKCAAAEFVEIFSEKEGSYGVQLVSGTQRALLSSFDKGSVFEYLLDRQWNSDEE